ncbi:MAG TPA: DcrB-related protein [Nitrososphaeraceae archaeon]|nr:DcrB-related protein [Nitrososphaeraceae archaeon]
MKLKITIFLSITITTLMFYFISNFENVKVFAIDHSTSLITYNNSKLNFLIHYPSNWNLTERKFDPAIENISSTVEITSPFEGPQDLVQEQLLISVNKLQKDVTFDEYVDNALNQFKREYREFRLIANNSTIIDNHEARKISYSYIAGNDPLSIELIMNHNLILDNDRVYVLSFGTPPDKYYNYINLIQQMIDSFKILN